MEKKKIYLHECLVCGRRWQYSDIDPQGGRIIDISQEELPSGKKVVDESGVPLKESMVNNVRTICGMCLKNRKVLNG